jgi:hypothetical protein
VHRLCINLNIFYLLAAKHANSAEGFMVLKAN